MKKLIALIALIATSYSLSANALWSECKINYAVNEAAFLGVEAGFGGQGMATCRDLTGNWQNIPVNVNLVGVKAALISGGLMGKCTAYGSIYATGPGFELSELLSAVGKVELGNQFDGGTSGGAAAKVTPFLLNGQLAVSATHYVGACMGVGDASGILMTEAAP